MSTPAAPTPAIFARRKSIAQSGAAPSEMIRLSLGKSWPRSLWVAQQAGIVVDEAIAAWIEASGSEVVMQWVSETTPPADIARQLKNQRNPGPNLLARLVQEEHISTRARDVAPYLRGHGLRFADVLVTAREHVANAALDAAFELTWKRRTVFARALRLARKYLAYIISSSRLVGETPPRAAITRMGMATVLSARFANVSIDELREALEALLEAHELGAESALTYFLEGAVWLYDLHGDAFAIRRAAAMIRNGSPPPVRLEQWYLNCADIWLKIAGEATLGQARTTFMTRARQQLESARLVGFHRGEDELRFEMMEGLFESATSSTSTFRGASFPFGLRSPHLEPPRQLITAAPSILQRLQRSSRSGEFVYRDVASELQSYLARHQTDESQAIRLLQGAIATRLGGARSRTLKGTRQELSLAEDRLLLARYAGKPSVRLEALRYLLSEDRASGESQATCYAIVATDIEASGPVVGALPPGIDPEVATALRLGDADVLYGRAAHCALSSHGTTRVALGGRGGVLALRDLENASGHTFVFKQQTLRSHERDAARSSVIKEALSSAGVIEHAVIDHLTTIRSTEPGEIVTSVRRYSRGSTLYDQLSRGGESALKHLASTVRFLAFIHATEMNGAPPTGVRRTLKEAELGRWLREFLGPERGRQLFERWWNLIADAPQLPRRDAHSLNWLVEPSGTIVALDFDACGHRPFGYELAQLLEDQPVLAGDDWDGRLELLRVYVDALREHGALRTPSNDQAIQYFSAGLLARVVQVLTNPTCGRETKLASGRLLEYLASSPRLGTVSEIAREVVERWWQITGLSDQALGPGLSDAQRRRLSRAMAFHLRHDRAAPASRGGWIDVTELALLMNRSGHKVSSTQVKYIAGALGENRFELDGEDVRALYGHSTKVRIEYAPREAPTALYHATPLRNLSSVLEALDGLRSGARQWVHLTESVSMAAQSARRHHGPIAVLEVTTTDLTLVHASGPVWLVERVPVAAIQIVSIERLAELEDDSDERSSDYW